MTDKTLKVLLLEDMPTDQELIKRQVRKVAPNAVFTVAADRGEFLERITWMAPDLILADYRLPDYNGLDALLHVKEKMAHVPFIFITGTLNDEEKVAEAVLNGASGYLLKENLNNLPQKLESILDRTRERFAQQEAKWQRQRKKRILLQKLQGLLEQAPDFPQKDEMVDILQEVLGEIEMPEQERDGG